MNTADTETTYIDATPTWVAIAPIIRHAMGNRDSAGYRAASEELMRMAELADRYNHIIKRMGEAAAREYLATYGQPHDLAGSNIEGSAVCTD